MASGLLRELGRRVLFIDGAMGTSIHKCDCDLERDYLGRENCTEIIALTRPEVIQGIHESFLEAGADCVETDTFGANKLVFAEFDLVERTRELNRIAAEVARAACDRHATADRPRFVLGSMGPGTRLITLGHTGWDEMLDSYAEQARGLLDGGVDALIIETCQDLLQVKCAVNGCLKALEEAGRSALDVPIMVSVTIETTGAMLLGTEIGAALAATPVGESQATGTPRTEAPAMFEAWASDRDFARPDVTAFLVGITPTINPLAVGQHALTSEVSGDTAVATGNRHEHAICIDPVGTPTGELIGLVGSLQQQCLG